MIESARDYAIIGVSIEGIILSWNSGAELIFGYGEDEIIGQSADILFTPADRKLNAAQKEIETALKTGSASDERWHIRKDGSQFFASGVLHELRSDNGQLLGFVKIARDQTDKLAAEKVIRDHEMLKKVVGALEDERRRIARDLHDELGQQLTALRLKLEHCRKISIDQSFCKEIDEIQSIAKKY
ncbi:MAG: PAS domain S-box protein [Blastocatellia bacterium]|nr:PAS domain S-box protein [Blastocatellia bacterium]